MKIDLCKLLGVEEGEEFKLKLFGGIGKYRLKNGKLEYYDDFINKWVESTISMSHILDSDIIKLPKKKEFTDDELCVLKNIDKKYKLVARDKNGDLYAYPYRPMKGATYWGKGSHESLFTFNSLFTEIKWEDEEPNYIDDYVER